jgi:hypothetical protein
VVADTLKEDIDYLIIGADGSPCWTFACYGRKVEKSRQYAERSFKTYGDAEFQGFIDSVITIFYDHYV